MAPILPGATIGIFGGGQLGRMTAMAARSFGYRIQVLDPDQACPAAYVADHCIAASFADLDGAVQLGKHSDVVTIEIEKVSLKSLEAAAQFAPVRPSSKILEIIQDRGRQKQWLVEHGFPVGEYQVAASPAELRQAAKSLGGKAFAKAAFGGYDGRGQFEMSTPAEAEDAWAALRAQTVAVEKTLDLECEISMMVARRPSGETAVFPPAMNHHEHRILEWSVTPAPVSHELTARATELARVIAEQIQIEGLLAVEMFVTRESRLLVNELAPRPHNSFHATQRACVTSQFEQLVRSVCDLPLGSVELVQPAAISNLLGDLWLDGRRPDFVSAVAIPGVRLHLYEKHTPRPGRKMGHLSAVGHTVEEALERVKLAKECMSRKTVSA
ncbi:MAG TPA: 5-(carboxyamino)imidazole ribonucleotide synthase [Terriglobales bacterium]|nr:5-(carboxyamino)imidazole ribonucleotide synthase [Terriglobales bacterium]